MKADRLEPGMAFGTDPVLLGELPLEEVRPAGSRESARETGPSPVVALPSAQLRAGAVGEDGVEVHVARTNRRRRRRARRLAARA